MSKFWQILNTAALILAIFAVLYQTKQARNARADAAKLRAEQGQFTREISGLQGDLTNNEARVTVLLTENSRLKNNPGQTELLKLRNEVTHLRPLQDDVVALQKMLKQSSVGLAEWKTNELADAGRANPLDAIQTFLHSMQSEPAKIQNGLIGDDIDPPSPEALENFTRETVEQGGNQPDVAGYKILSQTWMGSDKVKVEILVQSFNGSGVSETLTLRNINGEWKLVVYNIRNKDGAVSQLDFVSQ